MSLDFKKVTYVDGETVIGAKNLNDIQDAILDLDDNKVEKEQGKGLSTNDYTTEEKAKVAAAAPASALEDYRTAEDQDEIDAAQNDEISDLKSAVDDSIAGLDSKAPAIIGTTSGIIASFEDGANGMPLKSLRVKIEPMQSGTGDPSPTNIRPIAGWTGCQLYCGGKNLISSGITVGKGYIDASGNVVGSGGNAAYRHIEDYIRVYPNTAYTISGDVFGDTTELYYNAVAFYDINQNFLPPRFIPATANTPAQFTTPPNCAYIQFNFPATGNITGIQMEYGNAATAFDSQASVYSITFPTEAGTVYDGTLTINADGSGELHKHPYYASYNGESLVGPWVSSMDVYAPGTTPTIGAQAVDLGGVETIYQLTAQQVTTLLGTNNIWADCGPVSVNYPVDTGSAIAKQVSDLKSAVDNGILSALYDNLDYTLTIGAGVNPSTGGNYNNQARYARTSSFNLQEKRTIAFAILDPTYEYVVWAYSGASTSSATYSPTNSQYVSTWVFIPYTGSDRHFRVGIQRTDHASMTSGDDPSTDESRLKKAIKVVHLPATADMALFTATNEITREFGGTVRPFFRQGSGNFNDGYYVESPNLAMCATPTNALPTLTKGDTITLSDGYSCLFGTIERSGDVILRKKDYGEFTGAYTIQESGIYLLTVKKVNGESINIDEARAAVTIQHNGTTTLCNLPKNPYKHIAKNKIAENDYEWSSLVKDIKSTCHLHTSKALYFTRARLAGYDHIAVSNYHASKPTVPIADVIKTLDGYRATRDDVPNTWLENPNAEHVYFTDADSYVGSSAGSHLHLCSVGSYVTSGSDNTSVGEGGFEGTVLDFAKAFEEMRQYPNGGGITINHPAWSGISKDGILNLLLKVPNVFGMEIYNSNAEHGTGKGYALDLWDDVLATGNQIFGTAVPDHETEGLFWEGHLPLGFIHLLCITKTDQEIMLAYRNGRFYTTIGNDTLLLKFFGIDDNGLVTFKATDTGAIKFVTAKRTVTVENNNTATFQTQSNDVYVRAEIETATNRLFTNAIML